MSAVRRGAAPNQAATRALVAHDVCVYEVDANFTSLLVLAHGSCKNTGVTAPIVGATKLEHLDDAVAAGRLALDADEIERLEEPYPPHWISGHS